MRHMLGVFIKGNVYLLGHPFRTHCIIDAFLNASILDQLLNFYRQICLNGTFYYGLFSYALATIRLLYIIEKYHFKVIY